MVDLDFVFIFLMFGNLEDKHNVINAIRNMKLAKTTLLSKLSAVHNFCCTRTLCLSLTNAHTHTETHTHTHTDTHTHTHTHTKRKRETTRHFVHDLCRFIQLFIHKEAAAVGCLD